ncbi:putative Mn2+ efflux pump MntP [Breznakia blatticola]|uniref:Putative manganese efflux pump MntP n=1 Tax=Breznakia blatticola TaxID=1754012 RepID=A0A4R7ZCV2_9FIRM|nr:manganese efflux pump MntP family protein [Breznakia blatticola]TDW14696.1 putative Mn2+ efflux pump MntP [Breznakia blatticola]
MSILTILLTSIGLAMDACAVSLAKGMCYTKKNAIKFSLVYAISFGFFQGIMPLIGYTVGVNFTGSITFLDHWIAFILLVFIGIKMIYEAFGEQDLSCELEIKVKDILLLGIATSIDALAVGVSFAFFEVDILFACIIIGLVTFALSFLSGYIGRFVGSLLHTYAEVAGGVILILIGSKILIEHLFF